MSNEKLTFLDIWDQSLAMIPANILFTVAAQYLVPGAAKLTDDSLASKIAAMATIPPVLATLGFTIAITALSLVNEFTKSKYTAFGEFLKTKDLKDLASESSRRFLAGTATFSAFVLSNEVLSELCNLSDFPTAILANAIAVSTFCICTKLLRLDLLPLEKMIGLLFSY